MTSFFATSCFIFIAFVVFNVPMTLFQGGWWQGDLLDKKGFYFPETYVKPLEAGRFNSGDPRSSDAAAFNSGSSGGSNTGSSGGGGGDGERSDDNWESCYNGFFELEVRFCTIIDLGESHSMAVIISNANILVQAQCGFLLSTTHLPGPKSRRAGRNPRDFESVTTQQPRYFDGLRRKLRRHKSK